MSAAGSLVSYPNKGLFTGKRRTQPWPGRRWKEEEPTMYTGRGPGQTSTRRSSRQAPHGTSPEQDVIFGDCQLLSRQ